MSPYSIPPLLTSIIALLGGAFIFSRNFRARVNVTFTLLCLATFWWQFSWFLLFNAQPNEVPYLIKLGYSGIIFIPIAFFHFISAFLEARNRAVILVSYLIGTIFLYLNWSTNWFTNGYFQYSWGWYPKAGPLHFLHLLQLVGLTILMCSLLVAHFKPSRFTPIKFNQIKYILLAIVLYFPAGVDYAINYGLRVYPFGFIFVLMSLGIFGYTVARYRLMEIRVAVTRAGIFGFVYVLVLGLPFYVWYQTDSGFIPILFMFALSTAGPIGYRYLNRKAEGILLAEQRRYQKILLQTAGGMTREHNLDRLLKLIVYVVMKAVKAEFAAVFLEDREAQCYRLKAVRDHHSVPKTLTFPFEHPLIRLVRETREPLSHEEIKPFLCEFMEEPVNLIIPSFVDDTMTGLLLLGEKKNRRLYTADDVNVFKILAHQASLAVSNCMFIDEFKKTQEKLFAAEKLAAVGGMADGVAHQIRNRLNQFSVAAGEQELEIDDFIENHPELIAQNPDLKRSLDYLKETAKSIVSNVKKTAGVIQGVLNFARVEEKETSFGHFPLSELIPPILELLCVKHQLAVFPLETEEGSEDIVYGVKSQIVECLYNLFDNAYEAGREKLQCHLNDDERRTYLPRVWLKAVRRAESMLISVRDNGVGIKDEHKKKIFAPFFTTKPSVSSGTGIGMYVVKRMIDENHGGKIWFDSIYLQGTTVYIELPGKEADSQPLAAN